MACSSSSANNHLSSSLFLLLILSSSLLHTAHSRDSQFFNKVSATTNNNNLVPQTKQLPQNNNQQPNFVPDNENGYGLSEHVSGQLPPSTTTEESDQLPLLHNKYLPKNYNPVAYVTQPEIDDDNTFAQDDKTTFSTSSNPYDNNNNHYYNGGAKNYYNNKQGFEEESAPYRSYPTTRNSNYYFNDPQGLRDTSGFRGGPTFSSREEYFNNQGSNNLFEPQGMSDTRLLENGKYFYDVNMERYSSSHPYERLRAARNGFSDANTGNINSEINNAYEFDNIGNGGYQNQDEGINDLP